MAPVAGGARFVVEDVEKLVLLRVVRRRQNLVRAVFAFDYILYERVEPYRHFRGVKTFFPAFQILRRHFALAASL